MAFRLYLVPIIGTGTNTDPRKPKYFMSGTLTTPSTWTGIDYGIEPWMVVGSDLSVVDDAAIVAQPDAFGLPFDLTPNLTAGQVTTVQNKLEAINLPADWVNTTLTWQQVVRIVLGVMGFIQRLMSFTSNGSLFAGAVTLATTISQLPASMRTNLTQCATGMNLDISSISGSTTLRQALFILGNQLSTRSIAINGVIV